MRTLTAVVLAVAGLYFAPAMHNGEAHAQDVRDPDVRDENVRQQQAGDVGRSLVYLEATGQVGSGSTASQQLDTIGTGFLVSNDGLVLTSYHLIAELLRKVETVYIEARVSDKGASVKPAAIVDAAINTDLLLLKLPPGPDDYVPMSLGNAYEHEDAEEIYTSGFAKDLFNPKKDRGRVGAHEAPQPYAYLWSTDMKFEEGQAGSPIYDDQGDVIGILTTVQPGVVHMIPIEYADALLAQVRLREIKQEMRDFRGLRSLMEWTGEYTPPANLGRGTLAISYDKLVPGKPLVASIDIIVRLNGPPKNTERGVGKKTFDIRGIKPLEATEGTEGTAAPFTLSGDVFQVPPEQLRGIFDYAEGEEGNYGALDTFSIDIIPHLTDETVNPKKSQITVLYKPR